MAEDGKGARRARVAILAIAVAATQFSTLGVRAEGGPAIELCCAWGKSLADGVLTYVLGGDLDPATADVLRGAVGSWDSALGTITLAEVPATEKRPDIIINFNEGAGDSEGLAITRFTRRGQIRQAELSVDAPRAPAGTGAIEQIAKHELGHALGLRHANFDGDIMSPIVNPVSGPLSACDVAAVTEANRWQTMDGRRNPRAPTATGVSC
ncbi:MAG: matrixin family metalloprotease [Acidimicrobiia bacterium]